MRMNGRTPLLHLCAPAGVAGLVVLILVVSFCRGGDNDFSDTLMTIRKRPFDHSGSAPWMKAAAAVQNNPQFPDFHPNLMNPKNSSQGELCESTLFYPFRVGCPATCQGYRSWEDNGGEEEPPFYRMSLPWRFGPGTEDNDKVPDKDEVAAYQGKSQRFAELFRNASQRVTDALSLSEITTKTTKADLTLGNKTSLKAKKQSHIHLNLAYLCCIYEEETHAIRHAMEEWIRTTFRREFLPMLQKTFIHWDRLSCWKERVNSITNIIIADDESQHVIMKLYMSLISFIHQKVPTYNPLVVPRQDQMPFHITLLGIYHGDGEVGDTIDTVLPILAKLTHQITEDSIANAPPVKLSFAPRASNPVLHNYPVSPSSFWAAKLIE